MIMTYKVKSNHEKGVITINFSPEMIQFCSEKNGSFDNLLDGIRESVLRCFKKSIEFSTDSPNRIRSMMLRNQIYIDYHSDVWFPEI